MRIDSIRRVLGLLSPSERRRGALVLAMTVVMAFIETVSVASVMPFLAVLGDPQVVEDNHVLAWLMQAGSFRSTETFLFALGVLATVMVISASLFRALAQYVMFRFVNMRRHSLGARLLQSYLRQPYEFFLRRNPAELSEVVLSEVEQLIQNVYRPGMMMLAYGFVAVVLAGFLIALDPVLALMVSSVLAGAYALTYLIVRRILGRIGLERIKANQRRFIAVAEALGGIKVLKLLGREHVYLDRFLGPSHAFARYQSIAETLSTVPKFFIEAIGLGGIMLLTLMLMRTGRDLGEMLPVLGLYAFAGYRLLPAAQHVYTGFARLRFGIAGVRNLHLEPPPVGSAAPSSKVSPLVLRREITLENVSYGYPSSGRTAIRDLSLSIPAASSVAFVGRTGAGKTTVIDLILGLLRPQSGRILIDGVELDTSTVRRWQLTIGYVPQDVYLADISIMENIAFGVPTEEIDRGAVEAAAKAAGIHEFIVSELPRGYRTFVGDRGVRLSGGQKQRIGIARALYHDPSVLVLDEATSALDSATERAIVQVFAELEKKKTIIMIAHRLSSVRHCGRIFLLNEGRLEGQGSYDELLRSNAYLRHIAGAQAELGAE